MSRESLVFFLGILIFLTPFLGVPNSWKEKVFIGAGVLFMALGYSLRRTAFLRSIEHAGGERKTDAFVESHRLKDVPKDEKNEVVTEPEEAQKVE